MTTPVHQRPAANAVLERFRRVGLKVTPQRMAVYRALASRHDHPGPESIHRDVLRDLPAVSLATVYKALDAFERSGLATQVAVAGESRRYDANVDPHHHLVCTICRRVIDYNHQTLDALRAPGDLTGFIAQSMQIQILGVCAACAEASHAPTPPASG